MPKILEDSAIQLPKDHHMANSNDQPVKQNADVIQAARGICTGPPAAIRDAPGRSAGRGVPAPAR
jgi:hypothetical protein